jgi:hypothetical protein
MITCIILVSHLICAPSEASDQQSYYGPRNVEQVYIRTKEEKEIERARIVRMKLEGKG